MFVFPPSIIVGLIATADIGFATATFFEGYNMYNSIQVGMFDDNKHYNVIEGFICSNISEEHGCLIFDISSIVVSVFSIGGNISNIQAIGSLKGSEIKAIITALDSGANSVTIGDRVYHLSTQH